jgi:PIN domain nuclease of toxin-antitoxin system
VSLVLDTHAAIWYLHKIQQLSETALRSVRAKVASRLPVFVSTISLVETVYLAERGRLPLEAIRRLTSAIEDPASGLQLYPLDKGVAEAVQQIPRDAIPDMPDRIIAATALYLGLALVTKDRRLQSAGIQTIW